MSINEIYRTLCSFYGITDALDIEHFLILTRPGPAETEIKNRLSDRETLFIRQHDDTLELGLYIAPEIIAALELGDPLECLEEFACAIEGASHFLYIADRAEKGRCVSQLELELQAEVDKFLLIHLAAHGLNGNVDPEFFERQFEKHRFDSSLGEEELSRYKAASQFAAKHCARLKEHCFNPLNLAWLMSKSRDFFNRDLTDKLSLLIP